MIRPAPGHGMPGAGRWLHGRSARARALISVNLGEGYGREGYYFSQICQDNSPYLHIELSLYGVGQAEAPYVIVSGSDVADLDGAEHLDVEMLNERRRVETRFCTRSSTRSGNELGPGNSVGCRLLTWEQIAGRSEAEIWAMFDQYTDQHIASPRRGVRQLV